MGSSCGSASSRSPVTGRPSPARSGRPGAFAPGPIPSFPGDFACRTAPRVCRAARTPDAAGRGAPAAEPGPRFCPRSACRLERGTSVPAENPPFPAEVASVLAPEAEFRGVRHLSEGPTRSRSGDTDLGSRAADAESRGRRGSSQGDGPSRRPTDLRFRPTSVPVRPTSIGNVRQASPPRRDAQRACPAPLLAATPLPPVAFRS